MNPKFKEEIEAVIAKYPEIGEVSLSFKRVSYETWDFGKSKIPAILDNINISMGNTAISKEESPIEIAEKSIDPVMIAQMEAMIKE
jgi:hypothetical protein